MRPPRADIAAPPFPPGLEWVGGDEPRLERAVAAGPLLVHFLDLAQLNSIRALPYLREWRRRYTEHGLTVLGVHSPRFPFTRPAEAVEAALPGLEIDWPVAVDAEFRVWRDYGCRGWPSIFLWGRGGALRWYHLGEGEYAASEEAIHSELSGAPEGGWPSPLHPLRASDAPGAKVIPPSAELLPGGSLETPWTQRDGDTELKFTYGAAEAAAAADGLGELRVSIDGGDPVGVEVSGPGLYVLSQESFHGEHSVLIEVSGPVAIHSIQFAAGPASA